VGISAATLHRELKLAKAFLQRELTLSVRAARPEQILPRNRIDGMGAKTRWKRIETLFHQASEVDTALRDDFIEQACAGDRELRAELDSCSLLPA